MRHEVAFDPKFIEEDIVLVEGTDEIEVTAGEEFITVNPADRPIKSGILESDAQIEIILGENKRVIIPVPNTCPAIHRNLGMNSSGEDVRSLQNFLKNQGHFTFPTITGYFGPVTERAVQAWQSANGVVKMGTAATTGFGNVGPQTRSAIGEACGNGPKNTVTKSPEIKIEDKISALLAEIEALRELLRSLQ